MIAQYHWRETLILLGLALASLTWYVAKPPSALLGREVKVPASNPRDDLEFIKLREARSHVLLLFFLADSL